MKKYDLIAIGTGSAMNIVEPVLQKNPETKIAVIDKDEPGGICLTRGCIPTKILLHPADVLRTLEGSKKLGIDVHVTNIDFKGITARMRSMLKRDMDDIRHSLSESKEIDYYKGVAEFVGPYRLKVGDQTMTSKLIFLCLGSKPLIPAIDGLDSVKTYTSDTILDLTECPPSITILGGGYIAAEYGHFFSAMGARVQIVGRNPRFLPGEETEVSALAQKEMSGYMDITTGHEVIRVENMASGKKKAVARDRTSGKLKEIVSEEILVAAGRASNTNLLHPERSGIRTDENGWIAVNEFLETSKPNIWAFGDANGKYLFKHVANYESKVVYYNAIVGEKMKTDYHAVPHAVFCHPEIAAVGMKQKEAVEAYGEDRILIGLHRYHNTAKGEAMGVKDYFVKVIVAVGTGRILGAHIIGPQASVLIQEIINLMYTEQKNMRPILSGMHIHPSLSEVVERAFTSLMPAPRYDQMLGAGWI